MVYGLLFMVYLFIGSQSMYHIRYGSWHTKASKDTYKKVYGLEAGVLAQPKKNEKIKKITCGASGPGVGGAESAGVWGWDSTQGDVGGSAV